MESEYTREDYLEIELQQALSTIEFMHGCLTEPHQEGISGGYTYAYPEMTEHFMEHLRKILPERRYCIHSKVDPECEDCMDGQRAREIRAQFLQSEYINDDIS